MPSLSSEMAQTCVQRSTRPRRPRPARRATASAATPRARPTENLGNVNEREIICTMYIYTASSTFGALLLWGWVLRGGERQQSRSFERSRFAHS